MKVLPVLCHIDNYAWLLYCEKQKEAIVIDPSESEPVLQHLARLQLQLTAIYCTHHHYDHVDGIGGLLDSIGDIPVFCHQNDMERISQATDAVNDDDTFEFCGEHGRVLHTPGHTMGSVCYSIGDYLFTGDTLFSAGCGRLFEGEPAHMVASLDKILSLSDDVKICFGHEYTLKNLQFALSLEPENSVLCSYYDQIVALRKRDACSAPSSLGIERNINPFLRYDMVDLFSSILSTQYDVSCTNRVEIFAALRHIRNSF